ncbi:MAG: hypothetical protein FJY92_08885, partial [Candidatus Hydrogenedentes bacterium]|nr:hypothetical protein [Candidatus Hydrogenedentota bacterium]
MKVFRIFAGVLVALSAAHVCNAEIPVVGGGGAGLSAIAGSDTLVTVVLKQGGAKDPNLKVVGVEGGILSVKTQTGQTTNYRLADVQEIRVQGEVLNVRAQDLMADRGLTTDQQEIVSKALARISEVFVKSAADQSIKMRAAEVLAVGGAVAPPPSDAQGPAIVPKQEAIEYLTALAKGNDLRTGIAAALHLAYAGLELPVTEVIVEGFSSGDRTVKANAA